MPRRARCSAGRASRFVPPNVIAPEDAGSIAVTGSHAALFRGQPDNVIGPALLAVFFNDAGVGMDGDGITRLPTLDERHIISGTVSADSTPLGDAGPG